MLREEAQSDLTYLLYEALYFPVCGEFGKMFWDNYFRQLTNEFGVPSMINGNGKVSRKKK